MSNEGHASRKSNRQAGSQASREGGRHAEGQAGRQVNREGGR